MDARLIDRRISCPHCAAPVTIVVDLSAGGQSYVEDCQVCCQPMEISFEAREGRLLSLEVNRGS